MLIRLRSVKTNVILYTGNYNFSVSICDYIASALGLKYGLISVKSVGGDIYAVDTLTSGSLRVACEVC